MGKRITALRKARNMAQTRLGASQQTARAYEACSRRITVSALPLVARTLSVSRWCCSSGKKQSKAARGKGGPVPQRRQRIEAVLAQAATR